MDKVYVIILKTTDALGLSWYTFLSCTEQIQTAKLSANFPLELNIMQG